MRSRLQDYAFLRSKEMLSPLFAHFHFNVFISCQNRRSDFTNCLHFLRGAENSEMSAGSKGGPQVHIALPKFRQHCIICQLTISVELAGSSALKSDYRLSYQELIQ